MKIKNRIRKINREIKRLEMLKKDIQTRHCKHSGIEVGSCWSKKTCPDCGAMVYPEFNMRYEISSHVGSEGVGYFEIRPADFTGIPIMNAAPKQFIFNIS